MYFSSSECIIWVTVFAAEFLAVVIVNLLSIIVFIKNRSLRTRSMYLVISLTVADMLVGGLSGSVMLLNVLAGKSCDFVEFYRVYREAPILFHILLCFFPRISLTNIAVISLERIHATFRPFRHRLVKRWAYVVAIASAWVFPGIVPVLEKERKILKRYVNLLGKGHCILCLLVIFASYTSIFFKFRFGAHPQRHFAANLRQKKLTITLFITTLVSLLMWLPHNIDVFLESTHVIILNSLSFPEYLRLKYSLIFLFVANSLVNPILYAIRMPDFKKALVSLFMQKSSKRKCCYPAKSLLRRIHPKR